MDRERRHSRRRSLEMAVEETPSVRERENTGEPERRNSRLRKRRGSGYGAVLAAILVTAVIVGVTTYVLTYRKVEEEFRYSRQPIVIEEDEAMEIIRENLEQGNSVTTALRKGFKDYLVVYSGKKYVFLPIDYSLKMHTLETENLLEISEHEWEYQVRGKTISYKGIDVSSHQGDIDWEKVAADGVEFAMIRCAYRGYGAEGNLVNDKKFEENIDGATAAGIHAGVYLFSQALTEEEMDEEVNLLLESIEGKEVTCPVVLDVELTESGEGRADSLSMEERTKLARRFIERVRNAGYRPMLYYNFESALLLLDTAQLEDCSKWYASYTKDFYYPYYYSVWQYTNEGTVSGIEGNVDMDMSFEKFW